MINETLSALFGNPYLFVFLMGLIVSFIIGYAAFDEKTKKPWMFGAIFAVIWAVVGGIFLLFIWAVFAISGFFGIPLLVLFALIVVTVVVIAIATRVFKTIIIVKPHKVK